MLICITLVLAIAVNYSSIRSAKTSFRSACYCYNLTFLFYIYIHFIHLHSHSPHFAIVMPKNYIIIYIGNFVGVHLAIVSN